MILFLRARGRAAAARAPIRAKRTVAAWANFFFLLFSLMSWGSAVAQAPSWVRPDQYYVFYSMPPSCPTAPNAFGICVLGEEYIPAAKAICGLIGLPLHPLFETTPPCNRCGFSSPVLCLSPTSAAPTYAGNLFGTSACNLSATEYAKLYPNDTGGHWVSCTPPPAVIDPNKNNGCSNAVGNPCNAATGNKFQIEGDYAGVGAYPLQFVRYYNSARARTFAGALGAGWSNTYDRSVSGPQLIDPSRNNYANATRPDGNIYRFNLANGQWMPDADVPDRLVQLANPSGWRYTSADDEVETYSAAGRLISLQDRSGRMQSLDYDASGRLVSVRDPFGRALQFAYDARGRIATLTDPGGGVFTFVYDGDNDLASVHYPDGSVRNYLYNEPANTQGADQKNYLTGIIDQNGDRYATFKYDFAPRVVSTEHAGGVEKYAFVEQSDGSTAVIDPLGTSRNYRFQTILSVAKSASIQGAPCPSCGNAATSYDANGFVSSRTDFNGNVTKFQRTDALGRLDLETARTEAFGKPEARTIATEWDSSFRLPHRIAEPPRITTTSYDTRGNVLSKTVQATSDATGALGFNATPTGSPRTWSYAYTFSSTIPGHVTHLVVDGPRNDVADTTVYDWDNSGNLSSITNALGHVTSLSDYDPHGRAQLITDPNGLATELRYDARGRITSRSVGGELTTYLYDGVGQLKTLTLPDGSALTYTYDAAHRLTQIQDSLGNHIVYTLDAMGNRIQEQVFDPLNTLAQVRSRAYDALNRLSQDIGGTHPLTQVTQYGYDNHGNLTSVTDPLGHLTANVYDALDRLAKVIDPAAMGTAPGASTQYAYDGADQLTQISDPRSLATTYTLDGLGNLTRLASPDTGIASSAFDAAGNILSQIDARGVRASFNYDPLNRITRATYTPRAGSTTTAVSIVYTYDQGPYALGRLTGISDANGSIGYGYEIHGRLVSDVRTLAGVSYATIYRYDLAGRLTRIVYPSGRSVDYSLDALGRIKQIDTGYRGVIQSVIGNVAYQPFGAATSFTFGNAQGVVRKLDLDGRTASYPLGGVTRNVTYDAASRITAFKHANAALDQTFLYDNLDRLTGWSSADTSQSFSYDAVGNRTAQMIDATPYLSTYSSTSNRLADAQFPIAFTYQYDEAGNTTQDALRSYFYDARSRLTQILASGVTTRFALNGLGQRVWKSPSNGLPRVFHYDQAGHLIAESTPAGEVLREYVYLGDLPVALISSDHDDDGVPDARDNCMLDANPNQRDTSGGGFGNICNGDANGDGVVNQADLTLVIALVHRPGTSNPAAAKRADMNGDGVLNYQDQALLSQWIRQRGVPGPSGLRGQSTGPELFFIYADQLGTPRVLVDTANKARWQWTATDPFGLEPAEESPQGDFILLPFNLRFPGQYYDKETGLHYNYFRDYDPTTGRYVESDPIGLRGGINLYGYAAESPTSYSDPRGLIRWKGDMYSVVFTALGGGGQFYFDLKSQCVDGKYAFIRVYASALMASFGAKYTGGWSSISFEDYRSDIYPQGFEGTFKIVSAGVGAVLTGGWSLVKLGSNTADFSLVPSPSIGFDFSVSAGLGRSMVISSELKECGCDR